jgi:hypothetical protein
MNSSKQEAIIDMIAGVPKKATEELNKLKAELFDKQGNNIMPNNEAEMQESIQKANRYAQLLQQRNDLWLAKLN